MRALCSDGVLTVERSFGARASARLRPVGTPALQENRLADLPPKRQAVVPRLIAPFSRIGTDDIAKILSKNWVWRSERGRSRKRCGKGDATHCTSGPSRSQRLIVAAMSSSSRDVGDGDTAATAPGCDTYSKSFTAPLLPWQSFPIIEEATAWAVVPDGCEGHSGSRAFLHAKVSHWIHIGLHAAGMSRVHLDGGFA